MLDERHEDLAGPPGDRNIYALGSIGHHNIVVTCLPLGKIGTVSAATVATQMSNSFPSIKFGLMVGIGGGVPPQVRLGDVVVGTPIDQYPGVVQWDLGKENPNGFVRTGALNNPPSLLLSAISRVQSEYELEGSKIPHYLNEMALKHPSLKSNYLKSESFQDVLFRADYNHNTAASNPTDPYSLESCRACDKAMIVQRKPRDMLVHYGLIASGNTVIKNAAFRDGLRRELGSNLLCVEMEAAGLMDNFPCLVIRGICDYADSHKHKVWQEHAAAVAAAYAKELLGYIQPSEIASERTAKNMLNTKQ